MDHRSPLVHNNNSRSYSSSHLPQTPREQHQFDLDQLQRQQQYIQPQQQYQQHQQQRPQAPHHTQSFPANTKQTRTVPSPRNISYPKPIHTHQVQSPGFASVAPQFAAPPKTPTGQPLPTSTFIPNFDYPQAGFASRPVSAGSQLHPKAFDNQGQFVIPQHQQQIPPVPKVQDIHVFNPSGKEKSLFQANREMMESQQVNQYQMDPVRQGEQMRFDPPPTQPIEQPPVQPEEMAYDQGYALNSNGQPHAPGQISHPNQLFGTQTYKNGLCGCFGDMGSCCLGCWCPCMLYSKTHHRLKTVPNSNLEQYSNCNGHCMMWCALAPVSWIFTMIQRTRVRDMYQIKGSPGSDCAKAYCCPVCVLVQDEREIRDREEEKRRCAGPGNGVVGEQGYKKPEKMTYQRSSVIG